MSFVSRYEEPQYPHVEVSLCPCTGNGEGACPKCHEPVCEKCEWRCETCLDVHHLKCLTPVEDYHLCRGCLGKQQRADELASNLFEFAVRLNRVQAASFMGDDAA